MSVLARHSPYPRGDNIPQPGEQQDTRNPVEDTPDDVGRVVHSGIQPGPHGDEHNQCADPDNNEPHPPAVHDERERSDKSGDKDHVSARVAEGCRANVEGMADAVSRRPRHRHHGFHDKGSDPAKPGGRAHAQTNSPVERQRHHNERDREKAGNHRNGIELVEGQRNPVEQRAIHGIESDIDVEKPKTRQRLLCETQGENDHK